jgi:phosphohistidine phosphatase SixA
VLGALGYDGEVGRASWLYPGESAESLQKLRRLGEVVSCVLLVGHNPFMTDFGALLCAGGAAGLTVRTGAIQLLRAEVEAWSELAPGEAELEGLLWPGILPSYSSKE